MFFYIIKERIIHRNNSLLKAYLKIITALAARSGSYYDLKCRERWRRSKRKGGAEWLPPVLASVLAWDGYAIGSGVNEEEKYGDRHWQCLSMFQYRQKL
jgi:hypothetical protein